MRNLFDEIVIDAESIAEDIIYNTNFTNKYFIVDTDIDVPMSFKLYSPLYGEPNTIDRSGFYCIFKHNRPIYVGATANSMLTRVGRFVKEVWGKSLRCETHSAAKKYRNHFGAGNFDGLELVYYVFEPPKFIPIVDIENQLIKKIKPLYNIKN